MNISTTLWLPSNALKLGDVQNAIRETSGLEGVNFDRIEIASSGPRGIRVEPIQGSDQSYLVVYDQAPEGSLDDIRSVLRGRYVPYDQHAEYGAGGDDRWTFYRPGMVAESVFIGDVSGSASVSVERLRSAIARCREYQSSVEALTELSYDIDEIFYAEHPLEDYVFRRYA